MSVKRIRNDGSLRNTIGDKINSGTGAIVNADVNANAAISQSKIDGLEAALAAAASAGGSKAFSLFTGGM
jgi:hypothetical protein